MEIFAKITVRNNDTLETDLLVHPIKVEDPRYLDDAFFEGYLEEIERVTLDSYEGNWEVEQSEFVSAEDV